jgi:hypothetical protein
MASPAWRRDKARKARAGKAEFFDIICDINKSPWVVGTAMHDGAPNVVKCTV